MNGNIFAFGFGYKTIAMLLVLAVLPNLLGLIKFNLFGLNIHVFQIAVFLAAFAFGPFGGLVSGLFGSVYTSILMGNPYILIGNVILGFFTGLFFRMKWNPVLSAMAGFALQLPWLYFSDVYLIGMKQAMVVSIIIALFIGNLLWAFIASKLLPFANKLVD